MSRTLSFLAFAAVLGASVCATRGAEAQVPNRFSVDDPSVAEGSSGTRNLAFTVTLDRSSCNTTCTVNWATSAGTAASGTDFTAASGTLSFPPPALACVDQAATVNVVIIGDATSENFETLDLVLSGVTGNGCSILDATGTGTIQNDDLAFSVSDASGPESGVAAPPMVNFTVTPQHISVSRATFNYATSNGTAVAGADYTASSGVVTFPPQFQSFTISVPVLPDSIDEDDETFILTLSNPSSGATISDGEAVGTIIDDDAAPSVSISGMRTFPEGNSGTTNAAFTVFLSDASGRTVTVAHATANGAATAGADYVATSGTLTFAPGVTQQTVNVAVIGDLSDEPSEDILMNLSAPVNATLSTSQAAINITDDDDAPLINIGDVTITEGNSGTSNAVFTVSLSAASGRSVTVNYSTANGTATAPADYTATSGTLTFPLNTASLTISVPVVGDLLDEANETFVVDLTQPSNATLGDAQATGTITDNDAPPAFSIADVTVTEGNSGTSAATFTVTLTGQSATAVTVDWATSNGTAVAPVDYTGSSGQLSFGLGVTTQTFTVQVAGDTLDEPNETFNIVLSNPSGGATLADGSAIGTITDNDAAPTVSVADVTVTETDAGSVAAVFVLTLSAASGQAISVQWATSDGTATNGPDYGGGSGTINFGAGTTQQTVSINVVGDTLDETNETFNFTLSNPTNATLGDATAIGTITDNDAQPALAIADATITETNAGSTNVTLTVSLSAASGRSVTVDYATANGTATAGSDYTARSGTLTFAAGALTQTFTVAVLGDTSDELDETFLVNLTNPSNATVGDAQATVTITDDDAAPSVSVADVTITEPNAGNSNATFTVTLSAASARAVTVDYSTADGTALAGSDYDAAAGTLTFAAGVTTQSVIVTVRGDTIDEDNETYSLNLSNPVNTAITDGQATGTITDNDAAPSVSIADVSLIEGAGNAVLAAVLSGPSGRTITVDYSTGDGSALAGTDYAASSGTLSFLPGATTATFEIAVTSDVLDENDENFSVFLSSGSNVALGDGEGEVTITDDDEAPSISIAAAAVTEGNSGTRPGALVVSLSLPSSFAITVDFATLDETATAPEDYAATSGTLRFAPGEVTAEIEVTVTGDVISEPTETLAVVLRNATNAVLAVDRAVLSITNDDQAPNLVLTATSAPELLVGGDAEVVFQVRNIGGGPTLGPVTLEDRLPAGLAFNTADGEGWTCTDDQGNISCENRAVLEASESYSPLRWVLSVEPAAFPNITHTATLTTSGDFDLADNSVELEARVRGLADLSVALTAPTEPTIPGQEISWSIRITNLGPNSLTELFLADELPAGLSGAIYAPAQGAYDEVSGLLSGIELASGSSVELAVSAMLAATAGEGLEYRATVSVPDDYVDPNGENDSAVLTFGVQEPGPTDTDGDGIEDRTEVEGRNPTDPLDPDTDGDGLCDGDQSVAGVCIGGEDKNTNGALDAGETDPNNPDSDAGGVSDGDEVARGTDPTLTGDDQGRGCDCHLSGRSGEGALWPAAALVLGALLITRRRRK